jgi:Serine/threonine protein phosphatase
LLYGFIAVNAGKERWFFGIFDGHCGVDAAAYAAKTVSQEFHPTFEGDVLENIDRFQDSFRIVEKAIITDELCGGSTAAVVYIQEDDTNATQAYISWVGDSRIMLCDAQCKAMKFISIDHKPQSPKELIRIIDHGGTVNFQGVWRVNWTLAMSRAFGDKSLKVLTPGAVIAEPEIHVEALSSGDIILVACDGFWDVMGENEILKKLKTVVLFCENNLDVSESFNVLEVSSSDDDDNVYLFDDESDDDDDCGLVRNDGNDEVLINVAQWLRDLAFDRGSKDNISVMVIRPFFKN